MSQASRIIAAPEHHLSAETLRAAQRSRRGFLRSGAAVAGGLLVLTAPLAPEAVVWNAGVFDLSMTTVLLAAALVARRYEASAPPSRRLALIVSLLEKRPIMLLDEWTAEQDPEFRRKFYDELLPEMLRAGATIVVITHDDRYLNELTLPSRRLRMDEGRFVEQRSMESV